MQLWMAKHKEDKKVKLAASSRPNLQKIMKVEGEYIVKRVEIGKVDKTKVCQLYMRKKAIVEKVLDTMTLVVEDGVVRKRRGSSK